MRRIIIVTTVFVIAAAAMVFAWGGKSGDKNATGHISDLRASESSCDVQGRTENGRLWLGYTVRWKDGYERDYDPLKVKDNFSKTLIYPPRPQGLKEVIVCLWRYKVSASRCAEENGGEPCKWCKKNGYHMEGRIDCKTGR